MDESQGRDQADWAGARRRPPEARRASRIECDLWVRVGGVDPAARARSGNISVTGLYVAIDEAVGSPGDVVWLSLTSIDKARSAQTMARVTRVVRQDDLHRGAAVVGAGFEFVPLEQPQAEVVELVRHVTSLALGMCGGVTLDHDHAVQVRRAGGLGAVAQLRNLAKDRVVISSPIALPIGEEVRLDIAEPSGGQIHVSGTVGASDLDGSDEPQGYAARAVGSLVDALIAPTRVPAPEQRTRDLSGQLSRVHLSSVLLLAELERLDGIVTVGSETCAARVYLSMGRVVDAEHDDAALSARDVVAELLRWTEGEFSLVCVPVRRADRFEMGTGALLLQLSREERVA